MLTEFKAVRQIPKDGFRRWFTDQDFDLFVWYEDESKTNIVGFQLCYNKRGNQKALTWFLLVVMVVSFLFALGQNTPVFPWLYRHVPTFDMFQAPARYTIWAVFALALLAGLGVEGWRRPEGRWLYWSRLGTMGMFAVSFGAPFWYELLQKMVGIKEKFATSKAQAEE